MARTKAISLIQSGATKVELAELGGRVIENIQKDALSSGLKSQNYTGNPAAGSVEYRRFKNASPQDYGTARTAGKGTAITAPPTVVNLDQHKEIVEEAAQFDLDTFGVGNVMARRADNHVDAVASALDTAFFSAAVTEGTAFTPTETGIAGILEELIQKLETVQNDNVDGVPRNLIRLVLNPKTYGQMRNYPDQAANSNVDTAAEEFAIFHGVRVYSSVHLPSTADALIMVDGAVAQPVVIYPYRAPERIPLSNDMAVAMFYDYGTKALTPDLIFYYKAAAAPGGGAGGGGV